MNKHYRHIAIALLLSTCLVGVPACSQSQRQAFSEPFFFIQMADPQFGMYAGNKDFKKETELFEKAVAHVNRLKPAFVVICGDLTNKAGDREQITELHRIAAKLDKKIPLYLVAGNHDVHKTPTPHSLQRYRQNFGPDWYSFRHGGCLFIVLNDNIFLEPDNVEGEMRKQWDWLQNELTASKENKPIHTVVFQHHPSFQRQSGKEDKNTEANPLQPLNYLELLKNAGVTAVFCGHIHRNNCTRSGPMEIVATSAVGRPLGKDPPGFRIVKVFRDRLEHEYYALDAVPLVSPHFPLSSSPNRTSSFTSLALMAPL